MSIPLSEIPSMDKIISEVHEDEVDCGFVATAVGQAIATQADSFSESLTNPRVLGYRIPCGGPHFTNGERGGKNDLTQIPNETTNLLT